MSEPANAMHKWLCMNYLPWFPSLSLCVRCAMSKYMLVAMQRRCEKYIVLAPKFNNIIVSTAAHSIVMLWSGRRCLPHVHGSVRGLCVCSQQHPSLPEQLDQESE